MINRLIHSKFKRVIIATVCLALTLILTVTVFSFSNLTKAVSVTVNGIRCGYVKSEKVAENAVKSLKSNLILMDNETARTPELVISGAMVSTSSLISSDELMNNIVDNDDGYISACGVYVNGDIICRSVDTAFAQQFIEKSVGDRQLYNAIELKKVVMTKKNYSLLPDISEAVDLYVDSTVDYCLNDGETYEDVLDKFSEFSPEIVQSNNNTATVSIRIPVFSCYETDITYSEHSVTAAQTGTKAGTVVESIKNYYLFGIKYCSETVETDFTEKYHDKPTATEIVSAGNVGFCWPVDTGYEQYISSFWGDGRSHSGYDIACKKGTPILCAGDGYVESINESGAGYGQHFIVRHGNGLRTLYAHCSQMYVSIGDKVSRGEVVALVGSTGSATGTHLHFEVIENGKKQDPMKYIGKR